MLDIIGCIDGKDSHSFPANQSHIWWKLVDLWWSLVGSLIQSSHRFWNMVINLNKLLCSTKVVYRTVSREYVSRDFNCRRTFCDRLCSARARTIMAQSWPGISWPLIHSSYPIPRAVEVLHQHDNPLGMSGACLWTESHPAPKRKKVTNRVSDKLFPIKDLRMTNASLVDSPSV